MKWKSKNNFVREITNYAELSLITSRTMRLVRDIITSKKYVFAISLDSNYHYNIDLKIQMINVRFCFDLDVQLFCTSKGFVNYKFETYKILSKIRGLKPK